VKEEEGNWEQRAGFGEGRKQSYSRISSIPSLNTHQRGGANLFQEEKGKNLSYFIKKKKLLDRSHTKL
jgi:hypothetical protein